ncbi:MAG: murein hydrolase activator EnvC family protein [Bacteroidaceae bacterium]
MMKRIIFLVMLLCLGMGVCQAQNSRKVKALQGQKAELQKKLKKSQEELNRTQKQVKTGEKNINYLDVQLGSRLKHIHGLESELDNLERKLLRLQGDLRRNEKELRAKQAKLKQAIRYARTQRKQVSPLLFVLSAPTITQMYRRARYAKEFVHYERNLGEQVLQKQAALLQTQNSVLEAKARRNEVLRELMQQRKKLNQQQIREKKQVKNLKQQEKNLRGKVSEQQKQLNALDKEIDRQIAYEIEQARKRAEEEARKKAAAEAAKRAQQGKGSSGTNGKETAKGKDSAPSAPTPATPAKTGDWLTAEDVQLNGSFEQNKGRLPVPITGQYMIGNHFGKYNVPGLRNVQLDNKGTNYVGKPGARARSVFDGVVSAVFQFGGNKNVLVRHGSYISVYCNLSSVIVVKGQKVHARDILGTVKSDSEGNCVLHFQLRKETAKLNPELWIKK